VTLFREWGTAWEEVWKILIFYDNSAG